jgi:phosphomannomutase
MKSNYQHKKVIVFDLDGTLAESKQPLDEEMATLLGQLIDRGYYVAVMSGGSFEQYRNQFLTSLSFSPAQYKKLLLLPTSGASLYHYQPESLLQWEVVYLSEIPEADRQAITAALSEIITTLKLEPTEQYGELIEDRRTQITYSGLGQQAPLTKKEHWDPDQKKRMHVVSLFSKKFPNFTAHIGGLTSVDITQQGIDKAYGIKKLSAHIHVPINNIVFVGDALFRGGNDEAVRASGVDCIAVDSVEKTKDTIRSFIAVDDTIVEPSRLKLFIEIIFLLMAIAIMIIAGMTIYVKNKIAEQKSQVPIQQKEAGEPLGTRIPLPPTH